MDQARYSAVKALIKQEQDGYSNLVIDAVLKKYELSPQQNAFCSRVFYGTLERRITLDARLAPHLKKPLEKMDIPVQAILRSGLYQVLYMDVPTSAAVNESVKLTRAFGKTSASGLVNAVLRRAAQDKTPLSFKNEEERLSVEYSVGLPVVRLLKRAWPERCEEILAASFGKTEMSVRVNTLRISAEKLQKRLAEKGIPSEPGLVPDSLLLHWQGAVAQEELFRAGYYHVQGQASQYAVYCLDPHENQRVLDLCAAPGGKTVTIAQYMNNTGRLFSSDLQANRLSLIRSALERCRITNTVVYHGDASEYVSEFCGADRVLCDVPCSGLGTLSKKPDIRYKKTDELEGLTKVQQGILENAVKYLKPNGRLVYSTCTINPAENEDVVHQFLKRNPEFVVIPPPFELPTGKTGPFGTTIFPDGKIMDGFFVAILQKQESV